MSEDLDLISGKTTIYAMIGHPVSQVQSPALFNRYFKRAKIDAVMTAIDIKATAAGTFFDFLRLWENCPGCAVTVPHKQTALHCVDQASARARRIGAVNVIKRLPSGELVGDMVDGLGYLRALENNAVSVSGKNMLLIGAGGVGSAIAHAVADAGVDQLWVIDTDKKRQATLSASLRSHYPGLSVSSEHPDIRKLDIVANATPLGMKTGDPLPYSLDNIHSHTVVTDVVTLPLMTPWLRTARRKGCIIQTGPEMTKPQMPLFAKHLGLTLDENILAEIL